MNELRQVEGFQLTSPLLKTSGSLLMALLAGSVCAGEWRGTAAVRGSVTLTDNVFLAPRGAEDSDVYLGLTLPLGLHREGSRVRFQADYIPSLFLYAGNPDRDNIQNYLRSLLSVEAVEDFFFVDAFADVSQTYISPFLARSQSGGSITENRTETITAGVSPYITGVTRDGYTYLARNENTWTEYDQSALNASFTSSFLANVESPGTRLRYGVDYKYLYTKYENQPSAFYEQLARFRPSLTVSPTLTVSGRVGYETNDYPLTESDSAIYGGGLDWSPTPRTRLVGFAEHRFFGLSYGVDLSHRTRLTRWALTGSRNSYTTVQPSLTLAPGTTQQVLDAALLSRIPDPIERQQTVGQLMARAGLPPELISPYTFYTNQLYLAEHVAATVSLLGRRNTATLRLFYQENQPLTASGTVLPDVLGIFNSFRQRGAQLTMSHGLSPFSTVSLTAQRVYALGTDARISASQARVESIQDTVHLILARQLSAKTYTSIGARWQHNDSPVNEYREKALFASVFHTF